MSQLKNIATICGLERAGMKQTNTEIVGKYDKRVILDRKQVLMIPKLFITSSYLMHQKMSFHRKID